MKQTHKFIFEGAELTGKTTLSSSLHKFLYQKFNTSDTLLNGCYHLYCDIGLFSTGLSHEYLYHMAKIVELLKNNNVVIDKFHISDIVYSKLFQGKTTSYNDLEAKILHPLDTSIVLVTLPEGLFANRLKQRLEENAGYGLIQKPLELYLKMQEEYIIETKKSMLPSIIIDGSLPLEKKLRNIIDWAKIPMSNADEIILKDSITREL